MKKIEESNKNYLKEIISTLGFRLENGEKNLWVKKYKNLNGYEIRVHLDKPLLKDCKIDYGSKIKVQRMTICNFSQPESIVVLECVNRLLEKGYSPEHIFLEKEWPLGHKTKGFLDILVADEKGDAFLMIECKTHGDEYRKEKAKMFNEGGQLFSYLIQEKTTQYLCLYSSVLENHNVSYENSIIQITSNIRNSNNQQEAFENWIPQVVESKGIFEEGIPPYVINFTGILKKELEDLKLDDGGFMINRFAEILRKNVVSDKTNAFNKIFNLFLCKIVDEVETRESDETKFQWRESESAEVVMLRLNDLYKKGMDRYLNLKISAVTDDELNKELAKVNSTEGKDSIRRLFIQQKLYTGNEFAFKEVFDKKTFELNSIVVKEVVKLLERKRIKYKTKQQFLGDFFERLLNTGIKQEAGQFFTPIPITTFICKSLPIKAMMEVKNEQGEQDFLPYVIDYASGSGHFLTEIMDEINKDIQNIDTNWIKGGERAREAFESERNYYKWAEKYVYGIEKDYRLAKTTKISTFLNGDGDANIIFGDGLDNFETSKEYKGKLKITADGVNNEQFDILVANPPYAVSGFKTTLINGKKSFNLFDSLTDQSSEIECLFVERSKQLLKEGGCAGIILPTSVLSNVGIYQKTRELILQNFEIKGMVELGGGTFMATNTNTVVLFLNKISLDRYNEINSLVNSFLKNRKDITINGIENSINHYSEYVFETPFKDYISFLDKNPSEKIKKNDIYQGYIEYFYNSAEVKNIKKKSNFKDMSLEEQEKYLNNLFFDYVLNTEKEKLINFLLTYGKKLVVSRTPEDSKKEKDFLGYEFSGRRGYEGIRLFNDSKGKLITKLYNESDLNDKEKINSYILKNFKNEQISEDQIPSGLKENMGIRELHEFFDFSKPYFDLKINVSLKKKLKFDSKYPLEKIGKHAELVQGLIYEKTDEVFNKTSNRIFTASNIDLKLGLLDLSEEKYLKSSVKIPEDKKLKKDDIFICTSSGSISHLGKSTFISEKIDAYFGGFCAVLRGKNYLISKYIYFLLKTKEFRSYVDSLRGQNINNLGRENLLNFKIPLPPEEIQKEIVKEGDKVYEKILNSHQAITDHFDSIDKIIDDIYKHSKKFTKLKEIIDINPSKADAIDQSDETSVSFIDMPSVSNDGYIIESEEVRLADVKRGYTFFQNNDVLFAKITPCMENGKGALVNGLINDTGFGSTEFFVLRTKDTSYLPEIIYSVTRYRKFRKEAQSKMTGVSGHRRVPKDFIEDYPIPVLSIPEQNEIIKEIRKINLKIDKERENQLSLIIGMDDTINKYLK